MRESRVAMMSKNKLGIAGKADSKAAANGESGQEIRGAA